MRLGRKRHARGQAAGGNSCRKGKYIEGVLPRTVDGSETRQTPNTTHRDIALKATIGAELKGEEGGGDIS